jgi:hypothetical protein
MARKDFPALPQTSDNPSEMRDSIELLRETVELLSGQRGDAINHSVLRGDIAIQIPSEMDSVNTGLLSDLIGDVANLQETVIALIQVLKNGSTS